MTFEWQGFLEPERPALGQGSTAKALHALGTVPRSIARSSGDVKRAAAWRCSNSSHRAVAGSLIIIIDTVTVSRARYHDKHFKLYLI